MKSLLLVGLLFTSGAEARMPEPPRGLDLHMPLPEDNPVSREKVVLGRKLFFDKRLSRDGTLACATCHDPRRAFSDGRVVARGTGGAEGARNSPAIVNRGYGSAFFWDGRAPTLERQVLEPIFSQKELGLTRPELERRTGLGAAHVAAALASYVRTIHSGGSRFDRYLAGRRDALTETERQGLALFRGKGNCVSCHVGPNFTDEQFHNTGVAWRDGRYADDGRHAITQRAGDRGAFKTPTLREVARTAPYMHDGSLATLEDVVEFCSNGGRANPNLDAEIRRVNLTAEEKRAIVAFLQALTGSVREGWR
ncbi:MAG: cytochrome-c peroxidase [Bryobacterales bacterium]|nr:cytochrome-c peroxidase [Bryobacterales bacterium]